MFVIGVGSWDLVHSGSSAMEEWHLSNRQHTDSNCITLLTIYFHNQPSYTIVGVNKIFLNVLKYVNAFKLGNSIVHVRQIIRSITNDIRVQRKMNL